MPYMWNAIHSTYPEIVDYHTEDNFCSQWPYLALQIQRGLEKESSKQSNSTFGGKESECESDKTIEQVVWATKGIARLSTRHSQENLHSAIEERFVESLDFWLFLTLMISDMSKSEQWLWKVLFQRGKSGFGESS
jgi:hypothetical protein